MYFIKKIPCNNRYNDTDIIIIYIYIYKCTTYHIYIYNYSFIYNDGMLLVCAQIHTLKSHNTLHIKIIHMYSTHKQLSSSGALSRVR